MRPSTALLAALLLAPGLAGAEQFTTHEVRAKFVGVDPSSRTLTVELEDGNHSTGPFEGDIAAAVKGIDSGDTVIVTCKDNQRGEHVAATKVRRIAEGPPTG